MSSRIDAYSEFEIMAVADTAVEDAMAELSNPMTALKAVLRSAVDRLPPSLARSRALGQLDHCPTLSDSARGMKEAIESLTECLSLVLEETQP